MFGLTTTRRMRAAEIRARKAAAEVAAIRVTLRHVEEQRAENLRLVEQAYTELLTERRHADRRHSRLQHRLLRALEGLSYWRAAEADQRARATRARTEVRLLATRLLDTDAPRDHPAPDRRPTV